MWLYVSYFTEVLLSGQSGADGEVVRTGTGICRSARGRDRVGSVLRIGTISLFLAQKAKQVYGVEIIPQAIENAKRNAVKNGIENAEFFVGKSEEVLPEFYEKEAAAGRKAHADVIVVDPPRKGCDEKLLDTIVKMAPDRVVYVSCDSATLARDLKILCEQGYELKRVRAVDQFCHTVHTEAVCCLHRVNM